MITRWTIENFKAFLGRHSLPFAPITILCGANSSGKSTIIQSILLMKQTLQYAPANRPIALNGPLLKLGGFSDIKNYKSVTPSIGLGWEISAAQSGEFFQVRGGADEVRCDVWFDTDALNGSEALPGATWERTRSYLDLQPALSSCNFEVVRSISGAGEERRQQNLYVKLARQAQAQMFLEAPAMDGSAAEPPRATSYAVSGIDDDSRNELIEGRHDAELVGATLRHCLPARVNVKHDAARRSAQRIADTICRGRRGGSRGRDYSDWNVPSEIQSRVYSHLISKLNELVRKELAEIPEIRPQTLMEFVERVDTWILKTLERLSERIQEIGISVLKESMMEDFRPRLEKEVYKYLPRDEEVDAAIPRQMFERTQLLHNYFQYAVRYLGPLRDDPKPIYPLEALAAPTEVGYRGEHTAAVMELNKDRLIEYIPSDFARDGFANHQNRLVPLRVAVNDWLKYLGIADGISTDDQGKLGHRLTVQNSDLPISHDLTNVGVGVSQVLPIIVMALLAQNGSVLILEQPELHLHPKVQTRLADFFLSMALLGKQCILETHSEYMIDRIRLRIAEEAAPKITNLFRLYFVEKREGLSECRDVSVSTYGAIAEWPDEFFDQGQKEREAILLAATHKKALSKKPKGN